MEDKKEEQVLLGNPEQMEEQPEVLFSQEAVEFLSELSDHIKKVPQTDGDGFLKAFGFWCRRQHLENMKREYGQKDRLGLGLIFHIAPSNMPGLFLWSMAIGILAGNSNIVRASARRVDEAKRCCRILDDVLKREKFTAIRNRIAVISYPSQEVNITQKYSSICDGRIIWGGDETIQMVRKCTISPLAEELCFPERFSAAIFKAEKVLQLSEEELENLAENFYRDTYDMDQNACSSPVLVLWYEEKEGEGNRAKKRFWPAAAKAAIRYQLAEKQAYEKYRHLCSLAIKHQDWLEAERYGNLLYVLPLKTIGEDTWEAKGCSGFFLEYRIKDLNQLKKIVGKRAQTLTFFGVDKEKLKEEIIKSRAKGFSRIIPVGQALEMDMIWDGKNLIEGLSRRIV